MANLLIIDAIADQYKAYLQPKFPGLSITTARTPAEAGELLNDAQILAVLAPGFAAMTSRKPAGSNGSRPSRQGWTIF